MAKRCYAGPERKLMRVTLALAVALLASGCGAQEAEKSPSAAPTPPDPAQDGGTPQGPIVIEFDESDATRLLRLYEDSEKQRANGAYEFGDVNQAPYLQK